MKRKILFTALLATACAHSGQRSPANVFDEDNRRLLRPVNDASYPWRGVGKLVNGAGGYCTATLVADSVIVTAAHCFYNLDKGERYPGTENFYAGFADGADIGYAKVNEVLVGAKKITDGDNTRDWAIARLDQPLGRKLGVMPMKTLPSYFALLNRPVLNQVAYHYDLGDGHAPYIHEGCRIRAQISQGTDGATSLLTDCDATEGASGSGVFTFDEETRRQVLIGLFVFEMGAKTGQSEIGVPFLINDGNEVIPIAPVQKALKRWAK